MTENAQTQRMPSEDGRYDLIEHRVTQVETRLTAVERTHEILGKLTVNVELLNDRVRLLLWVGGIIAAAALVATVGAVLSLLWKSN